jgi:hypothetical protein
MEQEMKDQIEQEIKIIVRDQEPHPLGYWTVEQWREWALAAVANLRAKSAKATEDADAIAAALVDPARKTAADWLAADDKPSDDPRSGGWRLRPFAHRAAIMDGERRFDIFKTVAPYAEPENRTAEQWREDFANETTRLRRQFIHTPNELYRIAYREAQLRDRADWTAEQWLAEYKAMFTF